MENTAEIKEAGAFGEAALKAMAERRHPANAQNYAVWFTYCSGTAPDLNRTIESDHGEPAEPSRPSSTPTSMATSSMRPGSSTCCATAAAGSTTSSSR